MISATTVRNKDILPTLDMKPESPVPLLMETYGGFGEIEKPHPLKNDILAWV
jgi:hypothetical protein